MRQINKEAAVVQTCIIIAVASAGMACTISKAFVFLRLRMVMTRWSYWGGVLIRCPYCTAHWFAIVGMAIYQPSLVHSATPTLDVVSTALAVITAATAMAGLLTKLWWRDTTDNREHLS